MIAITLHHEADATHLAAAAVAAVEHAVAGLGLDLDGELALVLTDDDALRDLNYRFREIDAPTDVLAFTPAAMPTVPGGRTYLGDIVISVPYAQRSAAAEGRDVSDEVRLLAVHGLLHLLGHDDETEAGAAAMRALESELGASRDT